MQRGQIRTKLVRRKHRIVFVLILLLLIGIIVLITLSQMAKKEPFISPVTKTSSQDAKKIEKLLLDAQIAFTSITLEANSSYKVKLESNADVIISLKKDLETQITSLQAILKQLTIDGKKFKRIDFTYDKPLVVYE